MMDKESHGDLQLTLAELKERLESAEHLIEAIRSGQVDAFAVHHDNQPKVFTLQSADYAYRILIENFSEGAVNITEDGLIVYCNKYFHEMLGVTYDKVVGNFIYDFIHPDFVDAYQALFAKALAGQSKGEIVLKGLHTSIPVYVSLTSLYPHTPTVGMIVSNLTEKRQYDRDTAEKNKFIETLLDASPDLIMVLDRELRFISFNNKAIEQFQFVNATDGLGKHIRDIIPHLDRRNVIASLKEGLNGKEKCIGEREVFKDGKYFDIYIVPIRNENEEIHAVMMTLRNVTEHAKNKQRLRRANAKMQERNKLIETIIEASHELIAVYDKDLTLLTMNKASENFTGWPKEKLIGKKLHQFYPNAAGSKAESDLKRALQGEFVSNEPYRSAVSDRLIRNYITPLRDGTGKIYAVLAIAQDVTDIVLSQQALQKTQEHFSLLFSMSPVAKSIIRVSDGAIIDVNPAWEKMFKQKRDYVIGKSMPVLGLQAEATSASSGSDGKLREQTTNSLDQEYTVGGKKLYAYTASAQFDIDGVPHIMSATIDTTQRRKDEEKIKAAFDQLALQNETLAQINTELASFSYIASHDLQEPLRKIQIFSHRILEKDAESFSPLTQSYFDRITNAAARMQKLIAALLDYSRTNTKSSDFKPTDLNTILTEVRTHLREMIIENKVSLRVGELPVIDIMPLQITQLFSNLLINSIKYRRAGVRPEITVEARQVTGKEISPDLTSSDDQFWEIIVRDNGIGFEPQHVEKIFGLFQRLHGKTEYEGTGIGLAICKKIVDNHKGYIKAIGKPGEGAEFLIYLPAQRKQDEIQKNTAGR